MERVEQNRLVVRAERRGDQEAEPWSLEEGQGEPSPELLRESNLLLLLQGPEQDLNLEKAVLHKILNPDNKLINKLFPNYS